MKMKQLAMLVGQVYCMAAETQQGAGGETKVLKKMDTETKKQIDAEIERIKGIEAIGMEEAQSLIEKDASFRVTQVELWQKIANYPTEAQAKAYRDGFERTCKTVAEKGGALEDSAKTIQRNVSVFNRIIRAVFGWNRRIEGTDGVERVYAEKMSNDIEANRHTILQVLKGPGTWAKKLDMIPKQEDAGGRPVKTEEDKVGDAYRKTIAQPVGKEGDASALANVMRVPVKVGKVAVPENKRQTLAIEGLIAAIKATPDANKPVLIETFIGIAMVSSDKVLQEWAYLARKAWNDVVGADEKRNPSTPVVTRRTAGAEEEQHQ